MLGLTLLALARVTSHSFDSETWSLLAAKFIVPFSLFHLAQLTFCDEAALRKFELFSLVVLAYLSFVSIAFLVGAKSWIWPEFILDESLGYHADRARGPFLQAVANGVSLNLLGLLAFHSWRRGTLRGIRAVVLLGAVPLAIVATMTRAVWLSFAGTMAILLWRAGRLRNAVFAIVLLAAGGFALCDCLNLGDALSDRLQERGPVDFRKAVYEGSWQMFLERPWTGWGVNQMPEELARHVSGYRESVLYPHNTYLELLVEHGLIGLSLYAWLMWELLKLRKGVHRRDGRDSFLDVDFRGLWPLLLAVYWVNASVVVMNYQFVNGFIFTLGGMLEGQRRSAERRGALSC
jgi:putative inorganic carbon (hco3(-)) transporter